MSNTERLRSIANLIKSPDANSIRNLTVFTAMIPSLLSTAEDASAKQLFDMDGYQNPNHELQMASFPGNERYSEIIDPREAETKDGISFNLADNQEYALKAGVTLFLIGYWAQSLAYSIRQMEAARKEDRRVARYGVILQGIAFATLDSIVWSIQL